MTGERKPSQGKDANQQTQESGTQWVHPHLSRRSTIQISMILSNSIARSHEGMSGDTTRLRTVYSVANNIAIVFRSEYLWNSIHCNT